MRQSGNKLRQLVREFISEALYDPINGYFSRNANLFNLDSPLDFNSMESIDDYQSALFRMYRERSLPKSFHQLWHTPSELFQPYYAEAIGSYILGKFSNTKPLVIYEIGPGSGTLCGGIANFLEKHKIIYEYHLIEVSERLHFLQKDKFSPNPCVRPRLGSYLDMQSAEQRDCIIIAMEVWDNLAQDIIMYADDGDLLQGVIEIDETARYYDIPGRYNVVFEPVSDKLILETVNAMENAGFEWKALRWSPRDLFGFLGYCRSFKWQYVPTGIYSFLKVISANFPQSSLIISDFDYLPGPTPGFDAPVVQTRYNGETINCSTLLLKKGLFDIFFPINFDLISKMLKELTGRDSHISKHRQFLQKFADCSNTRTRSGYNPMIEEYANVSFLLS